MNEAIIKCKYCKKRKTITGFVTSHCSSLCWERHQAHDNIVPAYAIILNKQNQLKKYLKIIKDEIKEQHPDWHNAATINNEYRCFIENAKKKAAEIEKRRLEKQREAYYKKR